MPLPLLLWFGAAVVLPLCCGLMAVCCVASFECLAWCLCLPASEPVPVSAGLALCLSLLVLLCACVYRPRPVPVTVLSVA